MEVVSSCLSPNLGRLELLVLRLFSLSLLPWVSGARLLHLIALFSDSAVFKASPCPTVMLPPLSSASAPPQSLLFPFPGFHLVLCSFPFSVRCPLFIHYEYVFFLALRTWLQLLS